MVVERMGFPFSLMMVFVPVFAFCAFAREDGLRADGRLFKPGAVVYEENFEDMSRLWIEGNTDNVRLQNGSLVLNANLSRPDFVLTAFVDEIFRGELYFEYKAKVLASNALANNINTFLYYSHPSGKGLKDTKQERMDSRYPHYHVLNGYIVTFLNARDKDENVARIRLRENPGFHLMNEAYKYKCEVGETYKLQFVFSDETLFFFIDDEFMLSFKPSEERTFDEGYFGFRTFATELAVSDFRVGELNP